MNEVHKWDDPTDALLSLVLLFLLFYLLYHDVFPCQGTKIHLVFFLINMTENKALHISCMGLSISRE